MAEKMILVCDTCEKPAVDTVTFKVATGNRQKDLCERHIKVLLEGSRAPRRGRKRLS